MACVYPKARCWETHTRKIARWGALTLGVGYLATMVPARRASKLVIREAMAHT
jgi:ABC-type lipoprotein release transport system permease subunit